MKIQASVKDGATAEVDYDLPETVEALCKKYSPEIVASHARRSLITSIQNYMRSQLVDDDGTLTAEKLQELVNGWKPEKRRGRSEVDKVLTAVGKMTPEQRAALLAELHADQAVNAA